MKDEPRDSQAEAEKRVKKKALNSMRRQSVGIWRNVVRSQQNAAVNWGLLVAPNNAMGEDRFDSQFWIANYQPTERYVLTRAGSVKFRLRTDRSGYKNLYLTGDWIDNEGLNIGCIEAAVMAGMQTARRIKATSEEIAGEGAGILAGVPIGENGVLKETSNRL